MAEKAGAAGITYAAQVKEIGFPEFTTKLITDTFDALVSANIRQQEAYVQLVEAMTKPLTTFINETKDEIGPEEILALFAQLVPSKNPTPGGLPTAIEVGSTLAEADVTTINDALAIETGATKINDKVAETGKITPDRHQKLLDAAATRIAANKYTLLQQMANQGMLRLVVTDGVIETSLNFRAYGRDTVTTHASTMTRKNTQGGGGLTGGSAIAKWLGISLSANHGKMTVETSNTRETSDSGMEANIRGGVRINFKTDYLPLSTD